VLLEEIKTSRVFVLMQPNRLNYIIIDVGMCSQG
jgi:hypothetical protein